MLQKDPDSYLIFEHNSGLQKEFSKAAKTSNAYRMAQLLFKAVNNTKTPKSSETSIDTEFGPPLHHFANDIFVINYLYSYGYYTHSILDATQLQLMDVLQTLVIDVAKTGNLTQANNILKLMKTDQRKNKAYGVIVQELLSQGRMKEAFETCLLINETTLKVKLLFDLAIYQQSKGYNEIGLVTIDESLKQNAKTDSIFKDSRVIARFAVLKAKLGDFYSADLIIKAITEADVRVIAWSQVGVILAKQHKHNQAREAFRKALNELGRIDLDRDRSVCLFITIESQAEAEYFDDAIRTATSIETEVEELIKLDQFLNGDFPLLPLCSPHFLEEEFFVKTTRDRVLGRIAELQTRSGYASEGLQTVQLIEWEPLKANALYLIGKAYKDAEKFSLAKKTLNCAFLTAIKTTFWTQIVYLFEIAKEQIQIGDYDGALNTTHFFDEACWRAFPFEEISFPHVSVKDSDAKKVFFRKILKIIDNFSSVKIMIPVLNQVVEMMLNAGVIEDTKKILLKSRDLVENVECWKQKFKFYLDIAALQAKIGYLEEACATFKFAHDLANRNMDIKKMETVAVNQVKAGLEKEALDTLREIALKNSNAVPKVAEVFVEQGKIKNFKKIIPLISCTNEAVAKMCILLARAYPEQAEEIAEIVIKYMKE